MERKKQQILNIQQQILNLRSILSLASTAQRILPHPYVSKGNGYKWQKATIGHPNRVTAEVEAACPARGHSAPALEPAFPWLPQGSLGWHLSRWPQANTYRWGSAPTEGKSPKPEDRPLPACLPACHNLFGFSPSSQVLPPYDWSSSSTDS